MIKIAEITQKDGKEKTITHYFDYDSGVYSFSIDGRPKSDLDLAIGKYKKENLGLSSINIEIRFTEKRRKNKTRRKQNKKLDLKQADVEKIAKTLKTTDLNELYKKLLEMF